MKKFHRRHIDSRLGASLVEMVVAMLVFGIVMTMVVGILSPAAKLFLRMEELQRAQVILDNTVQELYAMTETATGYIKIYGTETAVGETGAGRGPMLEFLERENYAVLISTGGCPETKIVVGGTEMGNPEPSKAPGRLLTRYYYVPKNTGSYQYQYEDAGGPVARAVSQIFTDRYYIGNYLEIEFSFPGGVEHTDSVAYVNADVKLYDMDSSGGKGRLIAEEKDVVLNFRYAVVRNDGITAKN